MIESPSSLKKESVLFAFFPLVKGFLYMNCFRTNFDLNS